MIRYFVCMLVLSLLAVSACTPFAHPTPESTSVTAPTAPAENAPVQTQMSSAVVANATPAS